ncbi:MAG: ABC transporter substrate-binding protein [Oscillospiraceae bacterium]
MKKVLAVLLSSVVGLSFFTACKQSPKDTSGEENVYKIGVVQLVEHPSLDMAYKGFVDGLKELGYEDGKQIQIDYQNAQGEQANCVTIADKLVNDKNDLILAIATPAAQAVANKTTEIPLLVTAVTDPADAKLVKDNKNPQTNVSGTSDMTPVANEIELLSQTAPEAKKIAMLYCSSEANSKLQVDIAKEACAEKGIETVDATVSNTNEVQQVVQSLVGKVDAIYVPTDNMIVSSMVTVTMVAHDAGIPVIVSEESSVKNGALAAHSLSYYNLGKQTAQMAVKILKDGADPAEMPIEYLENTDLFINEDAAAALNIEIPQELLDAATIVKTEK